MGDKNTLSRRDLIKATAMGVGAALLPAAATPRLTKAAVDGIGTVAATEQALEFDYDNTVQKPISKLGEAEYFKPMVIESSIEQTNTIREHHAVGHLGAVGLGYGMREITGRFEMYIEDGDQAATIQKFTEDPQPIKLELAQGPFNYRFEAYVQDVTIRASADALMTAEVNFTAVSMEVIENGSA